MGDIVAGSARDRKGVGHGQRAASYSAIDRYTPPTGRTMIAAVIRRALAARWRQ